ncbi:MAG: RIFT barrel domain-containing protein [Pirellulaceae bacterium]
MKVAVILFAIVLNAPVICECAPPGDRCIDLSFSNHDAWVIGADDPWWSQVDIRDVLNLFHPLVESHTGAAAGASRQCTIPADWQPPFLLRFHCADDYFADPAKHTVGMLGTESFFDHRFKQALIDDQVVWDRDVVDDNMPASQADFEVDITPHVTAGKPFKLSLRVLDKTSTLQRNDRDVRFIGGTWFAQGDGKTEEPPRFHTAVWFADPLVGEAAAVRAAAVGVRPNETAAAVRHAQRWPMPPPSKPLKFPACLSLVCPASIPDPGYPLTCGVPIPPGTLQKDQPVMLLGSDGKTVPLQSQVTGWWPDGSVRWLLLDAIAPPRSEHDAKFRLAVSEGGALAAVAPAARLAVHEEGNCVTIDTGSLQVSLGSSSSTLLDGVRIGDGDRLALADVRLRMTIRLGSVAVPVIARSEQTRVVESGPVSVCVESSGLLATDASSGPAVHVGRFTFRLQAYADMPTLRTSIRLYNDNKPDPFTGSVEDDPLEVTDLALIGTLPGRLNGAVMFGSTDGSVVETAGTVAAMRQDTAEHFAVASGVTTVAEGQRAQGWMAAGGPAGCLQVARWRFWQQAPQALAIDGETLTVGLFAATEAVPAYLPRYGEAKRHDLGLSFFPEMPAQAILVALGKLADEPPRLFDGPWFCESGALNLLDPEWLRNVPELAAWIAKTYGGVTGAEVGNNHWGLRNFGDFPYIPPKWRNGYYARILGAVHWGLASGDQRWLERSFEIARHIADVDTVHIRPGQSDWAEWDGMTCAIGEDHSSHGGNARWSAFMAADQLICHYWLTGDRDSRTDAIAGADFLLRLMPGVGSLGVREGTRPMLCLLRAWEVTADAKYLDAARKYCDRSFITKNVMDWRRGTYICPLYENLRIISAGQDAMYADAVYTLYRLTGELDYAQIVVAIADSVYAEAMLPQDKSLGDFIFYPRYGRNSWYFPQMAVLFCQAYDLTGDLRFLRAARAAQARYLLCTLDKTTRAYQTADNFGYVDPEYAAWATALRDVATDPFDITGMVSDPDPANFLPRD